MEQIRSRDTELCAPEHEYWRVCGRGECEAQGRGVMGSSHGRQDPGLKEVCKFFIKLELYA